MIVFSVNLFAVMLAATGFNPNACGLNYLLYCPSSSQQKVDASFSNILINTPISDAKDRLTGIRDDKCGVYGDCNWVSQNGVKHLTKTTAEGAEVVFGKVVQASDYSGKSIHVLGIGKQRTKARVLKRIKKFVGRTTGLSCNPTIGTYCHVNFEPGYLGINFDAEGKLIDVIFVGHFGNDSYWSATK
jgi:hypothetical protein